MRLKVLVLFGGNSLEHDISILTYLKVSKYINQKKYEIVPVYIDYDNNWYSGDVSLFTLDNFLDKNLLKENLEEVSLIKKDNNFLLMKSKGVFRKKINSIDIALSLVHSENNDFPTLIGYLKKLGIPCCFSNIKSLSLCQDKVMTKQILQSMKVPTPNYLWFYESDYLNKKDSILASISKLGYPVIVKPAYEGSSIGVSLVKKAKDIEKAIVNTFNYDDKIIIEEVVDNAFCVSISIYGNHEVLEMGHICYNKTNNEIVTFEDKYDYPLLVELEKKLVEEIKSISKDVFYAFDLNGIVKFDFLINNESKQVYLIDINPIPRDLGFSFFQEENFSQILDHILGTTIKEYKVNKKKISIYKSNILKKKNNG